METMSTSLQLFLAAVNALAFYNLAKPPMNGNSSPEGINSFLGLNTMTSDQSCPDLTDVQCRLMKASLHDVKAVLNYLLKGDHASYVAEQLKMPSELCHRLCNP